MEISFKQSTCLYAIVLCLTGCATTNHYKPQGLTEKEFTMKQYDLLAVCQHTRMGTYVNVKFYEDAVDSENKPLKGTRTGYFYLFDKMRGSISLSEQPVRFSDRGESFPLSAIESISPAQETARPPEPNIIIKAVQNFIHVTPHDPQRQLLTQ